MSERASEPVTIFDVANGDDDNAGPSAKTDATAPMVTAPPDTATAARLRPPSAVGQWATLVRREFLLEWRTRDMLMATGLFSALVVLVLSFSVAGSRGAQLPAVQAGLLWISFVFAATLGIGRSFARERESGALLSLLVAPLDWSLIYLAKFAATFIVTVVTQWLTLGLFAIFVGLNLDALQVAQLAGLIAAVSFGHIALGLLLAALTVSLRAREVLLPVLLFPLLIPLFLAALKATALILSAFAVPGADVDWWRWLAMVGIFDLVYFALGVLLFPLVIR